MTAMTSATEKRFARVQGNLRMQLSARMAEREDVIISKLVTAYRSGKLTSDALFGGIAAIAELRSIQDEAKRDLMQATDDAQSIFTN